MSVTQTMIMTASILVKTLWAVIGVTVTPVIILTKMDTLVMVRIQVFNTNDLTKLLFRQ